MNKNTRKQIAYDYLYNKIIQHELAPGTVLIEQEISNLLNISRTPVREAIKQLETEGLLDHIPQRGTFVKKISISDVEEIFSLREALEILALRTAIDIIPDTEITELEKILVSLNNDSPFENFYDFDRKLHGVIVKYGRNKRLSVFLDTLNAQIENFRRLSAMAPQRLERSKQEHIEILNAIKDRDIARATEVLRLHIHNIKKNVLHVCLGYNLP